MADRFLPQILVDSREPGQMVERLSKSELVDCDVVTLSAADYAVGLLGIERKTYPDFIRSLRSGRLISQAYFLKRNYSKRFLVPRTISFFTTGDGPRPRPYLWPRYFIAHPRDTCAVATIGVGEKTYFTAH